MEEQYGGMSDLRHYIDGRPLFPAISQPSLDFHNAMTSSHPYDMLVFRSDSTIVPPPSAAAGYEAEAIGGRWPRQETLTLLEIRSRLDRKFKEANQKGPLWDEVSRILWEEHGYERSGKKCREKFENLYKYYKKTKEGKGGRQDGKHYRFFRQLEALYGDHSNTNINININSTAAPIPHFHTFPTTSCDQEPYPPETSIPDSCESYCSESNAGDDVDARMKKVRSGKRSLKAKIEASIDAQMKEMMDKQDAWMEKMTLVIEGKEEERLLREEQWRKQDAARIYAEQKMWASERAWVESREAALMDAFNRLAGKELHQPPPPPPPPPPPVREGGVSAMWPELRSGMELRFGENGIMSGEMAGGGSGREKWDHVISDYLIKCGKKRKENAYQNRDPISDHGVAGGEGAMPLHGAGSRSSAGDTVNDGLFRYFIGDSYQRYYDLK